MDMWCSEAGIRRREPAVIGRETEREITLQSCSVISAKKKIKPKSLISAVSKFLLSGSL